MSSPDPNEMDNVRKIIEKSTSKVSLRDLEKKGFRKVKVLRSNDIDAMIRRAVDSALAGGLKDHDAIVERSRAELKEQMAAAKQAAEETQSLRAQEERLQQQLRLAQDRLDAHAHAENELRRRLAETEERAHRAESRAGGASEAAARAEGLERRVRELAQAAQSAEARLGVIDQERNDLRRRLAEAEGREGARVAELEVLRTRLREGDERAAKTAEEISSLRSEVRQLEVEKRLLQELELPRLEKRVAELTAELDRFRAGAVPAPQGASVDPEGMRSMLKDLLQEVGTQRGSGVDLAAELQKIQQTIAAGQGKGVGPVTEADEKAMKVSLQALFDHDDKKAVESNIGTVSVKESTAQGVKGHLSKLKALRKNQDG